MSKPYLQMLFFTLGSLMLGQALPAAASTAYSFVVECVSTNASGSIETFDLREIAASEGDLLSRPVEGASLELSSATRLELEESCRQLPKPAGFTYQTIKITKVICIRDSCADQNVGALQSLASPSSSRIKKLLIATAAAITLYVAYSFFIGNKGSLINNGDALINNSDLTPAVLPSTPFTLEGLPEVKRMTPVRADGDCGFYCIWAAETLRAKGPGAAQEIARAHPQAVDEWIEAYKKNKVRPSLLQEIEANKRPFICDVNESLRSMRATKAPEPIPAEDAWAEERRNPNRSTAMDEAIRSSDAEQALQQFKNKRAWDRLAYGQSQADLGDDASPQEIAKTYHEALLNRRLSLATFSSEVAQATANDLGRPIKVFDTMINYLTEFSPSELKSEEAILLYLHKGHYSLLHTNEAD